MNAEQAIPHLQMRGALSGGRGMLVSDVDKKPHLISCEATYVHEEVEKAFFEMGNKNEYFISRRFGKSD